MDPAIVNVAVAATVPCCRDEPVKTMEPSFIYHTAARVPVTDVVADAEGNSTSPYAPPTDVPMATAKSLSVFQPAPAV